MSTSRYATFSPEEMSLLPGWAKWKIGLLRQDRDNTVHALATFSDTQTPSPVSTKRFVQLDDTNRGFETSYVQTDNIKFVWKGVKLEVRLRESSDMHRDCIQLQWSAEDSNQQVSTTPVGLNAIELTASSIVKQYAGPKP